MTKIRKTSPPRVCGFAALLDRSAAPPAVMQEGHVAFLHVWDSSSYVGTAFGHRKTGSSLRGKRQQDISSGGRAGDGVAGTDENHSTGNHRTRYRDRAAVGWTLCSPS